MDKLDFPGVTIAEFILIILLLLHFLQIRHRRPIFRPILTLVVALTMAVNYTARIFHQDWFFVADAAMFWVFVFQVGVMVYYTNKEPKPADIVGASIWEGFVPRLVAVGCCVLLIMLVGSEVEAYMRDKKQQKLYELSLLKQNTEAKQNLAKQEKATATVVQSFSANQDTLKSLGEQSVLLAATAAHNTNVGLEQNETMLKNQGKALKVLTPGGKALKGKKVEEIRTKPWWEKLNPFSSRIDRPIVFPLCEETPANVVLARGHQAGEGQQ